MDLDQKLDLLMALATDDRDAPPPRLQHTREVGALRPLNIRRVRSFAPFGLLNVP